MEKSCPIHYLAPAVTDLLGAGSTFMLRDRLDH